MRGREEAAGTPLNRMSVGRLPIDNQRGPSCTPHTEYTSISQSGAELHAFTSLRTTVFTVSTKQVPYLRFLAHTVAQTAMLTVLRHVTYVQLWYLSVQPILGAISGKLMLSTTTCRMLLISLRSAVNRDVFSTIQCMFATTSRDTSVL